MTDLTLGLRSIGMTTEQRDRSMQKVEVRHSVQCFFECCIGTTIILIILIMAKLTTLTAGDFTDNGIFSLTLNFRNPFFLTNTYKKLPWPPSPK